MVARSERTAMESTASPRRVLLAVSLAACVPLSGCYLTKVASVPMRVVGAVTSLVPFVGNTTHDTIDATAEFVDDLM